MLLTSIGASRSSRIFQHMTPSSVTSGKTPVRTGRSTASVSPGSTDLNLSSAGEVKDATDGSMEQLRTEVKTEQDECLVEPLRQDCLEELDSNLPGSQNDEEDEHVTLEDDLAEGQVDDDEGDDDESGPESKRTKLEAVGSDEMDSNMVCGSKSCVDQGVPCPRCARHNKGIAACFAQGHLYLTVSGEVPSSCKECKQRNKGALFCFKRGHMLNLRAMLAATSADAICAKGAPLIANEDEDEDDDGLSEDAKIEGENMLAGADDAEMDEEGNEDVSGPVSPVGDECTL